MSSRKDFVFFEPEALADRQNRLVGNQLAPFDVAHFGSVCHWLAFPKAESYWEKQGQWNEAFELEFRTISKAYRSDDRYMTLYFRQRILSSKESIHWEIFRLALFRLRLQQF